MRITKVYTRKGDDGTTGLVGDRRVGKDDSRIAAYGAVDELNSAIGLACSLLRQDSSPVPSDRKATVLVELADLQNLLFTVGCDLATRIEDRWDGMPAVEERHITDLESKIDSINTEIPPLEEFVMPAGTAAAATLHLARTICRRAEREVVALSRKEEVSNRVIPYLNRLSDWLFVMARWLTIAAGEREVTWKH